jgi:hypothetical protein
VLYAVGGSIIPAPLLILDKEQGLGMQASPLTGKVERLAVPSQVRACADAVREGRVKA